jgi:hypothetical protein
VVGCDHFWVSIESNIKEQVSLSEKELFSKIVGYTKEFGKELVDVKELTKAVKAKNYSIYGACLYYGLQQVCFRLI